MNSDSPLIDIRRWRGLIWNVQETIRRFPFGEPNAPWNSGQQTTDEAWIDSFVYEGFRRFGSPFLRSLSGRFAVAFEDDKRGELFLARDWIGEEPFHYLATLKGFIVANSISALKEAAHSDYAYTYVRAFPQAHFQIVDLKDVRPAAVSSTIRLSPPELYYDFASAVEEVRLGDRNAGVDSTCGLLRERLQAAVVERCAIHKVQKYYLLLSGGLDSLSIAIAMKTAGVPFDAVTLSVGGRGGDVAMARQFAEHLGIRHHVIKVSAQEVESVFEEAIHISECYHVFNVYCAVGMHLLGKRMKDAGMEVAFCGEAVNEALGDYHDWTITDPQSGRETILQRINSDRLERVNERIAYAWGRSSDAGIYNKQLGTGLAKHAGSRMYKLFGHHGLRLESPYYDRTLLRRMIAIEPAILKHAGGKPGLFHRIFHKDLEALGVPADLVLNSKKVRFQDASEGGEGGITSILFRHGMDQKLIIRVFNKHFGAHLDPAMESRRLVCTASA